MSRLGLLSFCIGETVVRPGHAVLRVRHSVEFLEPESGCDTGQGFLGPAAPRLWGEERHRPWAGFGPIPFSAGRIRSI